MRDFASFQLIFTESTLFLKNESQSKISRLNLIDQLQGCTSGMEAVNNTAIEIGSLQYNNVVLETSFSFELHRLSIGFVCCPALAVRLAAMLQADCGVVQ